MKGKGILRLWFGIFKDFSETEIEGIGAWWSFGSKHSLQKQVQVVHPVNSLQQERRDRGSPMWRR